MQDELEIHSHKTEIVQGLIEIDHHANRKTLCEKLLGKVSVELVLITDEVHFLINGSVNKEKFCYFAQDNPWDLHQRPLYSLRVFSF